MRARKMLRLAAVSAGNLIQPVLTKYQCLINWECKRLVKCFCLPKIWGNFLAREQNVIHYNLPKFKYRSGILLSGILTFLGLQQDVEQESELIMTMKRGVLSMQRGEFDKAERILHAALQLAYEESNEDAITYIYDLLANVALNKDENAKAEKLFISVMQRLVQNDVPSNDNKIIHISLKLGRIYENTKDYVKAEVGYKYCIDHLQEKINALNEYENSDKDTWKLFITSLDNYARFLVNQNRANEGLEYFKKAFEISLKVNGKDHEDTALLLNDMGTTFNILGDIESAVSHIEQALDIGTNLSEMEHLSHIYVNLGRLYLIKQIFDRSKFACNMGLRYALKNEDEVSAKEAKKCLKEIKDALKNSET